MVPRKSEVDDIISLFYNAFKGEGARKLFHRIRRHYTGISIKKIQKWLNSNKDHFKSNSIFSNKPPLTPVIYVLSVLDVFSRYLWLRPVSGKNSAEVLKNLKEIFR